MTILIYLELPFTIQLPSVLHNHMVGGDRGVYSSCSVIHPSLLPDAIPMEGRFTDKSNQTILDLKYN